MTSSGCLPDCIPVTAWNQGGKTPKDTNISSPNISPRKTPEQAEQNFTGDNRKGKDRYILAYGILVYFYFCVLKTIQTSKGKITLQL